ncbi:thiolase family protein [Sphaerimonospora mesophila]|uniref:thiolase family protein n=1 Tax=Sphaerimonospora mesophila TaxID=37483 RepID=UPI0006E27429
MNDVYIVDAVRTPFGRYGGALAGIRPDDLAAHVIRSLTGRAPGLDPARIDDVFFGNANGAGEENRNVARMAALLAGLPVTVPGTTVNRLCASGLEAVIQAYRAIAVGDASIVIAGGVESMSRAPWVLPKPDRAFPAGDQRLLSTTLGWRMVNPRMPAEWTVALGEGAELIADRYGIDRVSQDAFALASHEKAARAWRDGAFDAEIVPLDGVDLPRDETIRDDTSMTALAKLKPAFRKGTPAGTVTAGSVTGGTVTAGSVTGGSVTGGTVTAGSVTAGNSSPLNDGAAALLLCDEEGLRVVGREPLARVRSSAVTGVEPQLYGLGPVEAARRALARAGKDWGDLAVVELNEAFAAQALGCLREWPELDPSIVNPRGGAIAIGHPLGASGARLAGAVAHQLAAAGSGTGLATLCIGVGQGLALVLER